MTETNHDHYYRLNNSPSKANSQSFIKETFELQNQINTPFQNKKMCKENSNSSA